MIISLPSFPSPKETLPPCRHAYSVAFYVMLWAYLQVLPVEKHEPRESERESRSQRFMSPFAVTQGGNIF